MTYIFLIAGKGSRLHPLTISHPKSLFKLDDKTTVLERMVHLIRKHDPEAKIVAATGFQHRTIESLVQGVTFVFNPFYAITNSIASLWFAKEHLKGDVVLINGDVVMSEETVKEMVCTPPTRPVVLLDSSIKKDGDYNVQVDGEKVVVMSKGLDEYCGEYAGVSKLPAASIPEFAAEMEKMVEDGLHDQWYEDVLVQMIFKDNFSLYYEDVAQYDWTEIDQVGDLVIAKKIHGSSPL